MMRNKEGYPDPAAGERGHVPSDDQIDVHDLPSPNIGENYSGR